MLYVLGLLALVCGCKQVQYVPVERVRTDSVWLTQVRLDSVVRPHSTILVKASRGMAMEELVDYLLSITKEA